MTCELLEQPWLRRRLSPCASLPGRRWVPRPQGNIKGLSAPWGALVVGRGANAESGSRRASCLPRGVSGAGSPGRTCPPAPLPGGGDSEPTEGPGSSTLFGSGAGPSVSVLLRVPSAGGCPRGFWGSRGLTGWRPRVGCAAPRARGLHRACSHPELLERAWAGLRPRGPAGRWGRVAVLMAVVRGAGDWPMGRAHSLHTLSLGLPLCGLCPSSLQPR